MTGTLGVSGSVPPLISPGAAFLLDPPGRAQIVRRNVAQGPQPGDLAKDMLRVVFFLRVQFE